MSRTLLESGNILIDAPPALVKFVEARKRGAPHAELLALKFAAQLTPARAARMAAEATEQPPAADDVAFARRAALHSERLK